MTTKTKIQEKIEEEYTKIRDMFPDGYVLSRDFRNILMKIAENNIQALQEGYNLAKEEFENNSQQKCKGGQTISDNVGSSKNPLQRKVLATSETSAYGLQATLEQSDYKTGSNMETTGDVRLKLQQVVSLISDGTPRSSNSADTQIQKIIEEVLEQHFESDDGIANIPAIKEMLTEAISKTIKLGRGEMREKFEKKIDEMYNNKLEELELYPKGDWFSSETISGQDLWFLKKSLKGEINEI